MEKFLICDLKIELGMQVNQSGKFYRFNSHSIGIEIVYPGEKSNSLYKKNKLKINT